jgi:hypothetical protein
MNREKRIIPWLIVVSWFGVSAGLVVADLGRFYGLRTIEALLVALFLIVSSFVLRKLGGLPFQTLAASWREYFASWVFVGCLAMLYSKRPFLDDIQFNAILFILSSVWIAWGDRGFLFQKDSMGSQVDEDQSIHWLPALFLFVLWGVFVMQVVWTF